MFDFQDVKRMNCPHCHNVMNEDIVGGEHMYFCSKCPFSKKAYPLNKISKEEDEAQRRGRGITWLIG